MRVEGPLGKPEHKGYWFLIETIPYIPETQLRMYINGVEVPHHRAIEFLQACLLIASLPEIKSQL